MTIERTLTLENNKILPLVFGVGHGHLKKIEQELGVEIYTRGGDVHVRGEKRQVERAIKSIEALYERVERYGYQDDLQVGGIVRMSDDQKKQEKETKKDQPLQSNGIPEGTDDDLVITTKKKVIRALTPIQADYMRALAHSLITFSLGPAGTGKTYLAVAKAVSMLLSGKIERIILTRPAIEAGEKLGFLPGDLKDKVDPYLRPIYDALYEMMPAEQVTRYIDSNQIEIAPLAFMRGRTLSSAFIILDEAQNTTPVQMKMFLTRLGENARMVVTGDLTQVDLGGGVKSGLRDAVEILRGVDDVAFVHLSEQDVVRHPLVKKIVQAYSDFYNV